MNNPYQDLITDAILWACELLAEAAAIVLVLLVNSLFWLVPFIGAVLRDLTCLAWLAVVGGCVLIRAAALVYYRRWKYRHIGRYSGAQSDYITVQFTAAYA